MSAYHKAAFTLDPTVEIPEDAAPAIGVSEAGTAEEIKEASDRQLVATLSWELAGHEGDPAGTVTFVIEPTGEVDLEGLTVEWDFGNGRHETGHDLEQLCSYMPGSYRAVANVSLPGYATLAFEADVTV